MTLTAAAIIANIRATQAACPSHGDTTAADHGPSEDWRSDWDADRMSEAEENRRLRQNEWWLR